MKNWVWGGTAAACLTLAVWGYANRADAQSQQNVLVIQGGTLIDGTGAPPIQNAVIIIQGNRIAQIGRTGQVAIPAGAQVMNANGKWITPGLIDAKANWDWEYGEGMLHWGVTSAMVSGGKSNDIGIAERDAINHGVFAGPRLFETVLGIRGPGPDGKKPDNFKPGDFTRIAHTAEDARTMVRDIVAGGADFITSVDGDGDPAIFAAMADEAHKEGKAVIMRAVGPQTRAHEAAMAGADVLIHTGEVGVELNRDPAKWKDYVALPPLAYADMDDSKVPGVVKFLVDHHVALEPDLMATDRGLHKNWKRVQQDDRDVFEDPQLRAYYPPEAIANLWQNVDSPENWLTPQQLEERRAGFANHTRFLRAFVEGGGHIVAASDINQSAPGLGVQQEMDAFQEDVGLTPMQALMATTKWTADAFRLKDIGSIEPGKLADLVFVTADPSLDVLNMRKIDTVIKDGVVVDRAYHASYRGGMFENANNDSPPVIDGQDWAAAVKRATANRVFRGGPMFAGPVAPRPAVDDPGAQPTPGIEGISAHTIIRGSPTQIITLTGFHFVKRSRVFADGLPVPARVMSANQIQVTLDQNLLARAGRLELRVKNPEPLDTPQWGGTSNAASILIPFEFTTAWSHNKY
jgi:hypothetical protein